MGSSTSCWRRSARARAGRWSCAASLASARPRCSSTSSTTASDLTVVRARGCGIRDGAALRRPASAVRAAARPDRGAAGPATSGARDGLRPERRGPSGPVPRRPGDAQPPVGGRGGAAAPVRRGRRAVARPRVGADAGLCGSAAAGGARGDRVRHARAGRGAGRSCPASRCTACGTATRVRCSAPRSQFMLDELVRDRVIAETRGNPLALLELPRGLTATQLRRRVRDGRASGALGANRGELTFAGSTSSMTDARRLLLVAAAEPIGDPLLLLRASERLGIDRRRRPRTDGLLVVDERVTFRHPLVRSAVYRSAGRRRAPGGAPGAGGGHRPRAPTRIAARGIWPRRRPVPTRTSRWSWSIRRVEPRRAAGSPRRPRSCSGRSRSPATRPGAPSARSQPPRRALRAGTFDVGARAARDGRRRPAGRAPARPPGSAAGRGRLLGEPRQRRPRRSCFERRRRSSRSIRSWRARPTSTRGARRCSPGDSRRTAGMDEVSREARAGRTAGRTSARVRPPAGRLFDGVHRRPFRRGAGSRAGRGRLCGRATHRSRRCSAGAGSRPPPP